MYYVVPYCMLLVAVLWAPVIPKKTGAPVEACDEMKPNHDGNLAQISSIPYLISFTKKSINGRNAAQLTLKGMHGDDFKGFLVKAVDSTNVKTVLGKFDVSKSGGLAKTLDCFGGKANAVTHVNPDQKFEVVIEWTAPRDLSGKVQFLYTVVKDFKTFWVNGRSQDLDVTPENDPVTTQQPITTTKPKGGGSSALQVSVLCVVVTLVLTITMQ